MLKLAICPLPESLQDIVLTTPVLDETTLPHATTPTPNLLSSYDLGVSLAVESGHVIISPEHASLKARGITDKWSHTGNKSSEVLRGTNCRGILTPALDLIALQYNHCQLFNKEFRFLELGPGAGLAAATVSRAFPEASIESVSLSPVNPYLRWRTDDIESLWNQVPRVNLEEHYYAWTASLQIEDILRSQERRECSVLDLLDTPYIDRQHIGLFPTQVSLPKEHYKVLYDSYGALTHLSTDFLEGSLSADRLSQGCAVAMEWLSKDGFLIVDNRYGHSAPVAYALSIGAQSGEVLVGVMDEGDLVLWLLIRPECPLLSLDGREETYEIDEETSFSYIALDSSTINPLAPILR